MGKKNKAKKKAQMMKEKFDQVPKKENHFQNDLPEEKISVDFEIEAEEKVEAKFDAEKMSVLKKWRWLFYSLFIVILLAAANFGLQLLSDWYFQDKVMKNVFVNDIDLSMMTIDEASNTLSNHWSSYWDSSSLYLREEAEKATSMEGEEDVYSEATMTGKLPMSLLWRENYCSLNEDSLRSYVLEYGKNTWWGLQLYYAMKPKVFTLPLNCDVEAIDDFLKENLVLLENPARNAYYQFDAQGNLMVEEGEVGRVIERQKLLDQILDKLVKMEELNLSVTWEIDEPNLKVTELEANKEKYLALVEAPSISIELPVWSNSDGAAAIYRSYDYMRDTNPADTKLGSFYDSSNDKYVFAEEDYRKAETTEEDGAAASTVIASLKLSNFKNGLLLEDDEETGAVYFQIEAELLRDWLKKVDEENRIEATNAVLEVEILNEEALAEKDLVSGELIDGDKIKEEVLPEYRVVDFVSPKVGRALDIDKSFEIINEALKSETVPEKLLLEQILLQPETEGLEDNPLQITELVGLGVSNFSGSPSNRIHNIWTGASKISGILLAPGEEWHTIDPLKPFNAAGGYLPELVIKGDKTIPEYGGGLCQVATTVFRAAIDAGMPITQRRPHGYNVSYYTPIGTDATIYDPYPDFRFINDSENYILVQSYAVGSNLYVELWGVKDGRKVELTEAVNYNWTGWAEARYIDNPELAAGVTVKKESAHQGVTGEFWRRVTYPDGKVVFKKWVSVYPVKPAVYERGPEAGSATATDNGAGSEELDGSDGGNTIIRPGDIVE